MALVTCHRDDAILSQSPNISEFKDEVKRNYQRNEKLIDLSKIPNELENEILTEFRGAPHGDRSKLLNYFIKSRLKNLTETIGEF